MAAKRPRIPAAKVAFTPPRPERKGRQRRTWRLLRGTPTGSTRGATVPAIAGAPREGDG